MRRLATSLLVVMIVLFIFARSFENGMNIWSWLRAFSEAAMVGALADWFAVTALFRHPLGLPIPHTAVVKKEKIRIAQALARFVRGSFLSPDEVARQWTKWKPLDRLLKWGSTQAHARKLIGWLVDRLPQLIGKDETSVLSKFGIQALEKGVESLPMGKLIGIGLQGFLQSSSRRAVIAPVLTRLGQSVQDNRDWVMDEAARSTKPKKNKLFDKLTRVATAAMSGKAVEKLSAELVEAGKDETHRLYDKIEQSLLEASKDLTEGDSERWADLKKKVLNDEETRLMISEVFQRAGQAILEGTRGLEENGTLDEWAALLANAIAKLRDSEDDLEGRCLKIATRLAENHGSDFEKLISQTVASWEVDELIDRLENQVGPDLQFIRINGTIIGGLVGLLLHAVEHLIWSS